MKFEIRIADYADGYDGDIEEMTDLDPPLDGYSYADAYEDGNDIVAVIDVDSSLISIPPDRFGEGIKGGMVGVMRSGGVDVAYEDVTVTPVDQVGESDE